MLESVQRPVYFLGQFALAAGEQIALVGTSADDQAGSFQLTTGNAPAANAVIVTVTFAITMTNAPKAVSVTPANANAIGLGYVPDGTISNTGFQISSGATALAASTVYKWHWNVAPYPWPNG